MVFRRFMATLRETKPKIMSKKVLIVAANPATHPALHYPVGFWASEVFHPIEVFTRNSIAFTICSPEGGEVRMDPMSNPNDESGYSAWDTLSKKYIDDASFMKQFLNTAAINAVKTEEYDAIMVAGGQSPMFTFENATGLHSVFSDFYTSGKVAAALCHGVAVLNYAKDAKGAFLIKGKQATGFTNEEEEQANAAVNAKIMPWHIEDELNKKGARFKKAAPWTSFTVVDENLITGQQNMSGEETARRITERLQAL